MKFELTPVKRRYTNQKQLRAAFWETHPHLEKRAGGQNRQSTTVRSCFVFWIDSLQKNGDISEQLAERATL